MSPEIIYCEQQTKGWFIEKLGIPSASNFSKILAKGQGKTRHKYMMDLVAELRTGIPRKTYKNEAMEWGIATEPEARIYYEKYKKVKVEQVGLIKCDGVCCSPDGLISEDGGLEIKCPDTTTHHDYILTNKTPSDYVAQVQGSLMVSKRSWWDFVSFDPRDVRRPFWTIRVERDEKYIAKLRKEIDVFLYDMNEIMDKLDCPI